MMRHDHISNRMEMNEGRGVRFGAAGHTDKKKVQSKTDDAHTAIIKRKFNFLLNSNIVIFHCICH